MGSKYWPGYSAAFDPEALMAHALQDLLYLFEETVVVDWLVQLDMSKVSLAIPNLVAGLTGQTKI